jgi:adenosylcobinamide-phosphate synthase
MRWTLARSTTTRLTNKPGALLPLSIPHGISLSSGCSDSGTDSTASLSESGSWFVAIVPPILLVMATSALLHWISPLLDWLWNILVLYFIIGFRQVSHAFTGIVRALKGGDTRLARQCLATWRGESENDIDEADIAKLSIEEALRGAHRYVFGPLLWMVAAGPAGAVFYRLASILRERWCPASDAAVTDFGRFAHDAFRWIDWIPSRLTAGGFAIAGNFEDAFYCWRTQAASWPDLFNGTLLASGAGALGVKLGGPVHRMARIEQRPDLGIGDEPDINALDSTVGLIWRATVIWMIVLLLVTIARWTAG